MIEPIPAPGFRFISGKRNPPAGENGKYWVQLRNGWVDRMGPWPVAKTRWKWGPRHDDFDVIAVRAA